MPAHDHYPPSRLLKKEMASSQSWLSRWTLKKCGSDNGTRRSPSAPEGELHGSSLASFRVDDSGATEAAAQGLAPAQNATATRLEAYGIKEFGIWLSIVCGILCPFLDEGIIATAIPQIADDFGSLSHIGWYGSAYLMTMSAFQLVFGRLYGNFEAKYVFLISLVLFEIGSVLCAACPSSEILILGRAIAGVGAAGLCSGVFALFALALPARKLPTYIGAMGTICGLSAVLGPIIGGVITNSPLTWRWCFYINLPLAIPPLIAVVFFIHSPTPQNTNVSGQARESFVSKVKKLDYLGILLLIPGISCLVVALEFGSSSHGWGGTGVRCEVLSETQETSMETIS